MKLGSVFLTCLTIFKITESAEKNINRAVSSEFSANDCQNDLNRQSGTVPNVGYSNDSLITDGKKSKLCEVKNKSDNSRVKKQTDGGPITTRVVLEGDKMVCRYRECNFGNLLADALAIRAITIERKGPIKKYVNVRQDWSVAPTALVRGGLIHKSIGNASEATPLTPDVIKDAIPDNPSLIFLEIRGSDLIAALENVIRNSAHHDHKEFLQVSGIRIIYNREQPFGSRVSSVGLRCRTCSTVRYQSINLFEKYHIITSKGVVEHFPRNVAENVNSVDLNDTLHDAVMFYLKRRQVVFPKIEGRIRFTYKKQIIANGSNLVINVPLMCLEAFIFVAIQFVNNYNN